MEQADPPVPEVVRGERRHPPLGMGRPMAMRKRSTPKPWKTGRPETRSSRGTSAVTASNRTGGTGTQRARRVFATAAETRQRPRVSSTSPQVSRTATEETQTKAARNQSLLPEVNERVRTVSTGKDYLCRSLTPPISPGIGTNAPTPARAAATRLGGDRPSPSLFPRGFDARTRVSGRVVVWVALVLGVFWLAVTALVLWLI